jgi:hypothetical protein
MKFRHQVYSFFFFLFSWQLAYTQFNVAQEPKLWPEITMESKPWTRWWWMGSAVDQENVERLLQDYCEKGIGGVEITPVYGVKGEEGNYIEFLSEQWVAILRFTVNKAHELGMGVDMNTGTGWPFGGPHIGGDHAAKEIQFHELGNISQSESDQFVMQISNSFEEDLLALSSFNLRGTRVNLLEKDARGVNVNAEDLEYIAVTQRNTGQKVKRAAPGGEGLVFNHFSGKASRHYLKRFSEAFQGKTGVRSFFNDSYELSDANAASELFETFKGIKGYDLALYAREMNGGGDEDEIARIKADYRDILGAMLLQNFTLNWKNWAGNYGALTRNQAHGSPGNLIDLYSAVDIPELETFHSTAFPFLQEFIDQSAAKYTESNSLFRKFASSAAHMKGNKLVSCESFTWLNEHFNTPLYQCKPELDQLFVQGVTHVFFHGTAYSPAYEDWPGWLFYASSHMEPNNPQWDHMAAMNAYITRCQSVLQAGQHTNDFLVFWSPDDYMTDAEGFDKKLTLHNSESWVHMPEIDTLLDLGYKFDFISDRIISESEVLANKIVTFDKSGYQCLVIPQIKRIKLSTFKDLLHLAENGAVIVFSNMPDKVTGFKDYLLQEAELNALVRSLNLSGEGDYQVAQKGKGKIYVGNMELALEDIGIERECLIDHGIKNISRKVENGVYYFIANHEKEKLDKCLKFKHTANNAIFLNPMNGEISRSQSDSGYVHIELEPGESGIIYFTDTDISGIETYVNKEEGKVKVLSNPWKLKAIKGGPELFDDTTLRELDFWTDLPAEKYEYFAGTCEYSTSFELEDLTAADYLLRFDKVEASLKVFMNDKEVAILWSFPFELNVGKYLRKGKNTLRLEVSNLGANRIRYLDQRGVEWKKFHNINMVNLDYKSLDASDWGVLPSGLDGHVELIDLTSSKSSH